MRSIPHHSPGDLITYNDRPALVLNVTRQSGWMDRIEILLPDGSITWTWAEDIQLKSHLR